MKVVLILTLCIFFLVLTSAHVQDEGKMDRILNHPDREVSGSCIVFFQTRMLEEVRKK